MVETIRYQIFVSSTFTDLKEERAEVLQAIWELECIPTGMEAFLATSESQWQVIQGVIDQCDYYVLIIGGRYGQITTDGISYTEKEYDYANRLGIPVLAFVHGDPDSIAVAKTEKSVENQARLQMFRERVMREYPIRRWTKAAELGGLVSRSLSREIRVSPRPGWVRNLAGSHADLLERIEILTREKEELKAQIAFSIPEDDLKDLQCGADQIDISGIVQLEHNQGDAFKDIERRWRAITTWDSVFKEIGYALFGDASDADIKKILTKFVSISQIDLANHKIYHASVSDETFSKVITQFRALRMIGRSSRKASDDKQNYWTLTDAGDKYFTKLSALRKTQINDNPDS